MRIALIGDFHGNIHGLEAILAAVEKDKPDQIVCFGDLISPLPGSVQTWRLIHELNIPLLRGNHEDYIVAAHIGAEGSLPKRSVRFLPVRFAAKMFSVDTVQAIRSLPLSMTFTAPDGSQALLCHASPLSNHQSYASGIDETMADALRSVSASTIVSGHLHMRWHQEWEEKQLYLVGSGGLSHRGEPEKADYGLLEFINGEWRVEQKEVRYDYQAAIQYVLRSEFLDEAGPIGWLNFLELVTQRKLLMSFFHSPHCEPWPDEESCSGWQDTIMNFLKQEELWEPLQDYLRTR